MAVLQSISCSSLWLAVLLGLAWPASATASRCHRAQLDDLCGGAD